MNIYLDLADIKNSCLKRGGVRIYTGTKTSSPISVSNTWKINESSWMSVAATTTHTKSVGTEAFETPPKNLLILTSKEAGQYTLTTI